MLKILFIGDINGKIGRKTVVKLLPKLKKRLRPNLVIANAENIAHGAGVTAETLKEIFAAGVDWATNGDHAFDREKQIKACYENDLPVLRPANYSSNAPGKGYAVIKLGKHKILLINLIGRVFMHMNYDCPFKKLDEILALLADKTFSAIIIDIHAEATAEKIALAHYADGRVSAVLGTHTHVMTADGRITEKGTACITDIGMAGFSDGCIGIEKEGALNTFLNQIKKEHIIPETGKTILNAVLVTINSANGKAIAIEPIIEYNEVK